MGKKERKSKKNKTRKSKKEKMSTEDILKLLKKLKPKTQQIVKVNVGDKGKKKEEAKVSPYQSPFVVPSPTVTYSLPPPPPVTYNAQPAIKDIPYPAAPVLAAPAPEVKAAPTKRAPATRARKVNVEIPIAEVFTESEMEQNIRKTIGKQGSIFESFNAPRIYKPSNLSSNASQPSRFSEPVQNDAFIDFEIGQQKPLDQIGNAPAALPSDAWTGAPEGELPMESPPVTQPTQEELQTAATAFQEATAEAVMGGGENELPPWSGINLDPLTVRSTTEKVDFINYYIDQGREFNIPKEYLVSRGPTKGRIKPKQSALIINQVYNMVKSEI